MNKDEANRTVLSEYNRPWLFYGISIIIPWALWFTAGYLSYNVASTVLLQSIIGFVGLATPAITAFALMLPKPVLRADLFLHIFRFTKIRPLHLAATFLMLPFSILAAQAISLLFGYSVEQFHFVNSFSFSAGLFPAWFMLIAAPIIEEFAWHTYGTNCLRNKMNLFTTSVIFALFWGAWHLPLSFIKDYYQSNVAMEGMIYSVNFVLSLFPFVIIMNWIYYKTGKNLLLTIIFHLTAGFSGEIFQTHPMSKVIQTFVLIVVATIIIITDKDFFFKKLHAAV